MAFLSSADPETVLLSFEEDLLVFLRKRLVRHCSQEELSPITEISALLKLLLDKGMTMAIIPLPFNIFNIVMGKVPEMTTVDNFLVCFAYPQGFVEPQITMVNMHPSSEVVMLVPQSLQAKGVSLDNINELFNISVPDHSDL